MLAAIKCAANNNYNKANNLCSISLYYLWFLFSASFMFRLTASFVRTATVSARMMSDSARMAGNVKFFDTVKGFGFITPQSGGDDIFVHQSQIRKDGFRSLADNEEVEYDVMENPGNNRMFAANVTGPNGVPVQGTQRDNFGNDRRGPQRRSRDDQF